MSMDFIQFLNLGSLLVLIVIGFYCACKMNHSYPLWLRLIVLSPALSSFYKVSEVFMQGYIPTASDILQRFAGCLLYALVASKFSSKPWLEVRCSKPPGTPT